MRYLFVVMFLLAPSLVAAEEWRAGTPLPAALADVRGAVLNNKIYIMNGVSNRTSGSDFFELYDVAADGWRPLAPLPVSLRHFSLAAGAGRLYLSGGAGVDGDVWVYAPEESIWIRRARLPQPRAGHASAVVAGKLFLLGGVGEGAGESAANISAYNIASNKWEQVGAAMPLAVARAAVAVRGDEIILAGGVAGGGQDVAAVQAFNVQTKEWRRLPDLPQAASGLGLVVVGDKLHALGGYAQTSQKVLATHLVLERGRWRAREPMPQARHQMATATARKNNKPQIILLGGALGGGFYASFTASDTVSLLAP